MTRFSVNLNQQNKQNKTRTCKSSTFCIESEARIEETKYGFEFFNQEIASDNASLTSLSEGRITNMFSEAL